MSIALPIHRLYTAQRDSLKDHLKRLDPANRRMRFGSQVGDAFIDGYVDSLHWPWAITLVAVENGVVRAAGECVINREARPASAELAFSVEADYQGQGIGTALFERLLVVGRNRGIRRTFILTTSDNARMQRIAARYHMTLARDDDVEGRLELTGATPMTLRDEVLDESLSWMTDMRQRWRHTA